MKYVIKDKRAVSVWWATVTRCLEMNKSVDLKTEAGRDHLAKDLALQLSQEGLGVHKIEEGLIYRGRHKEEETVRSSGDA